MFRFLLNDTLMPMLLKKGAVRADWLLSSWEI